MEQHAHWNYHVHANSGRRAKFFRNGFAFQQNKSGRQCPHARYGECPEVVWVESYSSAYSNPAGLGMFNRSEFAFSFGYNAARSQASYLDNTTSETKNNFHIPGFGLVLHKDLANKKILMAGSALPSTG
ncbi:MAG: hypothetical protein U5K54_20980 [Cytophagales bacterium]|nr:hypothetical protein [Cytophagales bacterium]